MLKIKRQESSPINSIRLILADTQQVVVHPGVFPQGLNILKTAMHMELKILNSIHRKQNIPEIYKQSPKGQLILQSLKK